MAIYLPRHDTQFEPRTWSSGLDCNMAAAADMARYVTLGLRDYGHDWYRTASGDREGGTNIDQAQLVLDDVGVSSTAHDADDGHSWAQVATALRRAPIISHGDYGAVPRNLRGEISRSFEGNHSVLFHSFVGTQVRVGDGLSDDWMLWPEPVCRSYMANFPGGGMTYLVPVVRKIKAKVAVANVREKPTRQSRIVTRITPKSRIHGGGAVRGERIGSNATWFRVYVSGRVVYVHSSVATWA